MSMIIKTILNIYTVFSTLWRKLSDEQKEKVINAVVDSFTRFFRNYYAKVVNKQASDKFKNPDQSSENDTDKKLKDEISTSVSQKISPIVIQGKMSGLTHSSAEQFAKDVSKMMTSPEFLDELKNNLGPVDPLEGEEMFVSRAKAVLSTMLMKEFQLDNKTQ